jgi:hypothetical protein
MKLASRLAARVPHFEGIRVIYRAVPQQGLPPADTTHER